LLLVNSCYEPLSSVIANALAGAESADHPLDETPERQNHGKNIAGKVRINPAVKSFISWVYDVLVGYNHPGQCSLNSRGAIKQSALGRQDLGDIVSPLEIGVGFFLDADQDPDGLLVLALRLRAVTLQGC
jgi:hypothetical protein